MDRTFITQTGSSQTILIDRDLAHIGRVMLPSLHGDLGGPILPAAYWRQRLYQLLDSGNLSHAQLCTVDSLLLQLDRFETEPVWAGNASAAAPRFRPRHTSKSASHPA